MICLGFAKWKWGRISGHVLGPWNLFRAQIIVDLIGLRQSISGCRQEKPALRKWRQLRGCRAPESHLQP
jgi:hypothetical protein